MAKKDQQRLGKGLSAIFGENVTSVLDEIQQGKSEVEGSKKSEIPIAQIRPNPYQPRRSFDEAKLAELAESIRVHGVFTPVLVKSAVQGYELIAGERRLRAAKMAQLKTIPAIIVEFDDTQMMEIALLENIQREDLNAIEEAQGYEKLISRLNYTQEELAKRIGKSREYVANMLRLLKLPESVQQHVVEGRLSMGHVRALLSLKDEKRMEEVADKAIALHLSVRAVETLVKNINQPKEEVKKEKDIHLQAVEKKLQRKFQTKVKIDQRHIAITYVDQDDLNRILELLNALDEEL